MTGETPAVHEALAVYAPETTETERVPEGYKLTEVGVIPEDWETVHLSELLDFRNGVNADKSAYGEGTPFINVLEVITNTHLSDSDIPGRITLPSLLLSSYVVQQGDILFNRTSETQDEVGLASVYLGEEKVVFGGFVIRGRNQGTALDLIYSGYAFRSSIIRSQIISKGQGAVRANIGQQELSKVVVALPPLHEQRAIAAALSDVDALISALDELISKKQAVKTAAMQQLLTGKQRLSGFSGEWETKRLRDLGECLRGVSYSGDADLSPHETDETVRLLRSNNVQNAAVVTTELQFVTPVRVSGRQMMRFGDILVCMANGSKHLVGKAATFDVRDGHNYTFGAFMGCFRTNSNSANSAFVFSLFQTGLYRSYITNLLAGSSINNLKPSDIESLDFQIPSLEEQTAIAAVLSDMDAEIETLEARREKTRQVKRGMMQELLTGRTRLV